MQKSSLTFSVHPSSGVPIYRQLMDQVQAMMAGGNLRPGDTLPSVRQMAADLSVNMMTVSKAYAKLEAAGVLERSRGKGMVVAVPNTAGTVASRQAQLKTLSDQAVIRGLQLGLKPQQILDVFKASLAEHQSASKESGNE
jgi:GntR family transcriptional regulator